MKIDPEHALPDIWGEGALFAFSGLDGPTLPTSDFVATYANQGYGLLFHTPRRRILEFELTNATKVLFALSDCYAVETVEGNLLVIYCHWHTLMGWIPPSAQAILRFEDGQPAQTQREFQVTHDPDPNDFIVYCQQDDRFALAYGRTLDEAKERCQDALQFDVPRLASQRLSVYHSLPKLTSPAQSKLLRKCFSVMKANTLSPDWHHQHYWSTPDRVPHKHMWLWDSVFHSFAMNHYDPDIAWQFILSVLECITADGMIPHMMHCDGGASEITQPPILAWGVWENYAFTKNKTYLEQALEPLCRYLQWDLNHRDLNGSGLLAWHIEGNPLCRSGESGLDNSPRFDQAVELDAVDFSTFAACDMDCLAKIARELKQDKLAEAWQKKSRALSQAVHTKLWNKTGGFYCDRHCDGRFSPVMAVSGFFPLLLADCPKAHVEQLIEKLQDPQLFNSAFPVPSVAVNDLAWSTDMWRGATWINTNFLIIEGLKRQDQAALAAALTEKTISFVYKYYQKFGVLFEFYDAKDQLPPTQCDRKGPHQPPYNIRSKMDAIRDYHWTAALTAKLLLG